MRLDPSTSVCTCMLGPNGHSISRHDATGTTIYDDEISLGRSFRKCGAPKTSTFAFGLCLRSKTRHSKTHVSGGGGGGQKAGCDLGPRVVKCERSKNVQQVLSRDLEASLNTGLACSGSLAFKKQGVLAFALLSPLSASFVKCPQSMSTSRASFWWSFERSIPSRPK